MPNQSLRALPAIKPGAHIGILGGSFDPPHICHQLLGLSFLALEPIDELWVIPCANHANKSNLTDFTHRFNMCSIAFRRIDNVRVLDVENHLTAPNYTIETINFILNNSPQAHLHFGIGSDLVNSFQTWHDADDIIRKARIVIFERTSYRIDRLPSLLRTAGVHRGYALPDINSTDLREFLQNRSAKDQVPYVDRDVARYVDENHLYE